MHIAWKIFLLIVMITPLAWAHTTDETGAN